MFLKAVSGGEQVRLRRAALLAAAPEVLLLDEPTNHLDQSALEWLQEHLRTRRGTTVAVSHDRDFLERVATGLLEVDADRHRVVRHGNGYRGYLAERAAARRRWEQAHERWRADADRLREAAATTARRVAPGRAMKDGNKMAYDRAGGRVQRSLASRVRNAEERLGRLLADPVPPCCASWPERLRPTAEASPAAAGSATCPRSRGPADRTRPCWPPSPAAGEGSPPSTPNGCRPSACSSPAGSRRRPGSGSVSRWRACSATRPRCCCWTSRPTTCRPPGPAAGSGARPRDLASAATPTSTASWPCLVGLAAGAHHRAHPYDHVRHRRRPGGGGAPQRAGPEGRPGGRRTGRRIDGGACPVLDSVLDTRPTALEHAIRENEPLAAGRAARIDPSGGRA